MRPSVNFRRFPGIGLALGLFAVYAGAVFIACDGQAEEVAQQPPPEASATRPPPPPQDGPIEPSPYSPRLCPSPDPAAAATSTGQTFQIPGGATIPIPKGASTDSFTLNSTKFYRVSLGLSFIAFDRQGVMSDIGVHPEDCGAFAPTFAALYALMAQIPPPPLVVEGVSIPIPGGASMSQVLDEGGVGPGGVTWGIHRGKSYLYFNNKGVRQSSISETDSADFQPTLDAISVLAAKASE